MKNCLVLKHHNSNTLGEAKINIILRVIMVKLVNISRWRTFAQSGIDDPWDYKRVSTGSELANKKVDGDS